MASEAEHRLPRTVVPVHYDLTLEPDLEEASFIGSVAVDVDVTEPVTAIVLNAAELTIERAVVVAGDAAREASSTVDEAAERLILTVDEPLPIGPATVEIAFSGVLNDKLRGFYRSEYTSPTGEQKTIATTQFEATDARRAFPCWDEPDLKATYTVRLIVGEGRMAVSNAGEVGRRSVGDGKIEVSFAETMKMSTYLVAFVVGDMVATEPVDVDGVPLRIITPPGSEHLTGFALEMGAHALGYFAEYYDIPYPGDKLDMVAIPDFAWGAMENLGCITYRETALLLDPETATTAEKTRVADVIAHEIAHMWFGDLVTMKWWNGIWLNEAFATFAEVKCVDAFEPDWNRWLSFSSSRAASQDTDATSGTRPIEFPVASPEEANAMFDVLTYQKGSSVLRMLEQYLGEDAFRAGVTRYLKQHEYGNTETADLWAALEAESGEPVGEIMDTWIFQGGFPRITVTPSTDGGVTVEQSRFMLSGEGEGSWKVPVQYRASAGEGKVLVGDEPVTIADAEGIVVNAGGEGFYRVAYDTAMMPAILDGLDERTPRERYALISDSRARLLRGDLEGGDYLSLVALLGDEDEVDVWSVALAGVAELDRVISSDDRGALEDYATGLLAGKAGELGWQPSAGESDRTRSLRGLLLKSLGNLGEDAETIATAREVYASDAKPDAEVADAVLAIVAAHGDDATFDELIAASQAAPTPQLEVKYLRAATQVADPGSAERLFEMVLSGEVRSQDSFWVLALLLGHKTNGPAIWRLVTENWDATIAAMPPQTPRRLLDLIYYRSEPDVAASVREWLSTHEVPGGEAFIRQQLELLDARVGLREREAHRLGKALRAI